LVELLDDAGAADELELELELELPQPAITSAATIRAATRPRVIPLISSALFAWVTDA
jgi:hypothetical protein